MVRWYSHNWPEFAVYILPAIPKPNLTNRNSVAQTTCHSGWRNRRPPAPSKRKRGHWASKDIQHYDSSPKKVSEIMPVLNIKIANGVLHPLAAFKVLALMCNPKNSRARQQMMATVQGGTGVGTPRAKAFTNDEFVREVKLRANRGLVAGALLLTSIQLDASGRRASLNNAIPLVGILLDTWIQSVGPFWSPDCHVGHKPRSRRNMLDAFDEFLSVAHLWAALLHGGQQEREDIWPGSPETLPIFLAYASSLMQMGQSVKWGGRDRRFLLSSRAMWTVSLPERLKEVRPVRSLPLAEEQLAALPS